MNRLVKYAVVLSTGLMLISWGGTGHYIISNSTALSYTEEMEIFKDWGSYLADHASDADYRKSDDPSESPKHYIDIDYYTEFINQGYIPKTLNEAISSHGTGNVYSWGILPWATMAAFDSLKSNMKKNNWEKAKFFAADLGHYVADGHMPLHITKNYNGQLTDNDGIHSRYESTMIGAHSAELTYSGETIAQIPDVSQYILNYIYDNFKYVDSVIIADNYAKAINSSYTSSAYKNALWEKTGTFSITLFKNASHALAELIYTAWKEAGSPALTGVNLTDNFSKNLILYPVSPNPVSTEGVITFHLNLPANITLALYNVSGQHIETIAEGNFEHGTHSICWTPAKVTTGLYFISLYSSSNNRLTQKVIIK